MPNRKFYSKPSSHEETIIGKDGKMIGKIRITPYKIIWKSVGASPINVDLDEFIDWAKNRS